MYELKPMVHSDKHIKNLNINHFLILIKKLQMTLNTAVLSETNVVRYRDRVTHLISVAYNNYFKFESNDKWLHSGNGCEKSSV